MKYDTCRKIKDLSNFGKLSVVFLYFGQEKMAIGRLLLESKNMTVIDDQESVTFDVQDGKSHSAISENF